MSRTASIDYKKLSVQTAFQQCYYIVPDYQREYVWTEKEVQQLLDDIDEQIETGHRREYFVGTVLVSPTDQTDHVEIIDGQQRLTTFFLLVCALRQRFRGQPQEPALNALVSASYTDPEGRTNTTLKLDPRYESAGDLLRKLVEINAGPDEVTAGIRAANIPSFGSLANLLKAYGVIHRHLAATYPDHGKLASYWGYLANSVVFIQISTDVSSALKIFETINERGVGLNPMDLLKNLLFTNVRQEQFAQLKNDWKGITNPLEKEKEKPLRFLRYFLMANYPIKSDRGDSIVREDELYDWFVDRDNAQRCNYRQQPFEFVRKIKCNVDHYIAFTQARGNDSRPNDAMVTLKRLCGDAFSLHYILLLAATPFPKSLFDHFVEQLESFLFYFIFTKTPTKDLERSFSPWAAELRGIADAVNEAERITRFNVFLTERFQTALTTKQTELDDALKRYTLGSMQHYRTRYLLAKLTQHVEMAYQGLRDPGSLEPYMKLEIEHILPDNPEADLRMTFKAQNPGRDYDDYKIRLGNLTLLEKPINIVAGNSFYDDKKKEYPNAGNYLTRSLCGLTRVGSNTSINRVNEKLTAFPQWSAAAIDERQYMLRDLAADIWKIRLFEP